MLFTTTTNMPSFPPRFIFLFFSFLLFLFLFFLYLCYFLSCFSCFLKLRSTEFAGHRQMLSLCMLMTDLNIHMSGCKPTTSFVMLITKWKHRKKNIKIWKGFPGGSSCKESACNAVKSSSILGSGRSPGEGKGNSLQYSCLEKPMDRGAWWAIVHAWGHKKVRHDSN